MAKYTKKVAVEEATPVSAKSEASASQSELAAALVFAIESTRPQKKNAFNRKIGTPWTPKDGSTKTKLKRKIYQHGLLADEEILSNDEITLMNKLRPGIYMNGTVKVLRRKDRALDIDYPIKTASQRLKLINEFGIRNLKELLVQCITEAENPKLSTTADED